MPSRPQSKPSPQWQEYVWRATLSGQRGSGAAGSRPLRWVDGASGSAAVSLRRSKAIEPASRPKSHGISVSALNTVAPNAASKVGGAMVEACRIRQGPAHFTRPPVACRFAPIVGVPSYVTGRQALHRTRADTWVGRGVRAENVMEYAEPPARAQSSRAARPCRAPSCRRRRRPRRRARLAAAPRRATRQRRSRRVAGARMRT